MPRFFRPRKVHLRSDAGIKTYHSVSSFIPALTRPTELSGFSPGPPPSTLNQRTSNLRAVAKNSVASCLSAVLLHAAIGDTGAAMTTISLKIDEKLAASLDAEARALRTTRSELCRQAIAGLLRRSAKGKPTLLQQSKDLCGAGSSEMRDLSTNRRHLAGFGGKSR